jgi:hypothetical protein
MTDRYHSLTVILDNDIRSDDATPILDAIMMIKGVIGVKGLVSDPETWMAQERAKRELQKKLLELLYPEKLK